VTARRLMALLLLGRLAGIGVMTIPFWHRTPAAAPVTRTDQSAMPTTKSPVIQVVAP